MDGEVTALDDTALSIEGDRDGVPERIGPYQQLGILELFQHMSSLEALEFHFEDSVIRMRAWTGLPHMRPNAITTKNWMR